MTESSADRRAGGQARVNARRSAPCIDSPPDGGLAVRWLADGYTRVQSLFEQLRVARANLYSAEETLRLTRQRKQMGVGVLFEDIQAQQELLKVRTDLVDIVTELNQRRTPCCTAWAPLCTDPSGCLATRPTGAFEAVAHPQQNL